MKQLRTKTGLTQKALADLLGVHVVTVTNYERGSISISEPMARLTQRVIAEAQDGLSTPTEVPSKSR